LIGQAGVEATYDKYLRGTPGSSQVVVDSLGRPISTFRPTTVPQPGNAVRLTIDIRLQQAAEQALQIGLQAAHADACVGCWAANGGAVIALDPQDGSIRALASWPTYRPSLFAGRVTERALDAAGLTNRTATEKNYPGLDRAIDATYPAGSTWK